LKVRTGDLERASAERARKMFLRHRAELLYKMTEIGPAEYAVTRRWLGRFNTSLRTLDALHLAAASASRQQLWTTDKSLANSARALSISCKLIHA
jgi:predicted nucleic acid-binding protein